jgi:anaerobic magnesium-protoporphyrin IX monomethyl ester cyclase
MNVALVYRGRYHVREALDLETLASVLRRGGHCVRLIYDPDTFGVTDNVLQVPALARLLADDERTVGRIVGLQPDAVVFSVLSSTYAWCCRMAGALKGRISAPVVFLGLHPSLVPERVMRDPCVDYTIAGEAEEVINPLLDRIHRDGDVSGVANLWYRRNGRALPTARAELVDLDALPLPDKELFAPYVSHGYSYCAMVSRGCPYNCTFCEETCSKKLYGGRYFRRKSVDTVMRELAAGKKRYRYREVIFKDSYLSGNKPWLRELIERYRKEIRVPFKCFCTISGFDEETARLLKEGGCYSIEFGLQTWNDRLRREILNRRETSADAFRAFAHCDRQRLWYDVDHMFNLPAETEEDHVLGAGCYRRLRYLGRIKVHFLVYYPTADILEHAVAAGDLPPDAAKRLADGEESDFYDQSSGNQEVKRMVAGYAALYKVLPLLPAGLVRWLMQRKRVGRLGRIPAPLMALLQGLNALRCGDLRFLAYLRIYPAKILRTLWERIRPGKRSRRAAP